MRAYICTSAEEMCKCFNDNQTYVENKFKIVGKRFNNLTIAILCACGALYFMDKRLKKVEDKLRRAEFEKGD